MVVHIVIMIVAISNAPGLVTVLFIADPLHGGGGGGRGLLESKG